MILTPQIVNVMTQTKLFPKFVSAVKYTSGKLRQDHEKMHLA